MNVAQCNGRIKPDPANLRRVFDRYGSAFTYFLERPTKKGKQKVPFQSGTNKPASISDPQSWSRLDEALELGHGVNIALQATDLLVLDFDCPPDHPVCRHALRLGGYAERSPGGRVHVWFRGSSSYPKKIDVGAGDVEVLSSADKHFMSVTGVKISGPDEIPPLTSEAETFLRHLSILHKLNKDESWRALRDGGGDGESEQDMEAACKVSRHIRDAEGVEHFLRMFTRRERDKWNEPRNGSTWIKETIEKALGGTPPIREPSRIVRRLGTDLRRLTVEWTLPKIAPAGMGTLFFGAGGVGKSTVLQALTALKSTGAPTPHGEPMKPGKVIWITYEEHLDYTVSHRLHAEGGDPSSFIFYSGGITPDNILETLRPDLPGAAVVVIDTVMSYIGGRTSANQANEVNAVLSPLRAIAEEFNVAVLGVAHTPKSKSAVAAENVLGSVAFVNFFRHVWAMDRDPDDPTRQRRLMTLAKSNVAGLLPGFACSIAGEPPRVVWEKEPLRVSADEVAEAEVHRREHLKRKPRNDARQWLLEYLKEGAKSRKAVVQAAELAGITARTLSRAVAELKEQNLLETSRENEFHAQATYALRNDDQF